MEIIKCKFCNKLFFQLVDPITSTDFMYDYNVCKECNKKAKENTDEKK